MPRSSSQLELARRALVDDTHPDRHWVRHSVAVLAVTVLGIVVAGSGASDGNARFTWNELPADAAFQQQPDATVGLPGNSGRAAFDQRMTAVSRAVARPELSVAKAVTAHRQSLARASAATDKLAASIRRGRLAREKAKADKLVRARIRDRAEARSRAARMAKAAVRVRKDVQVSSRSAFVSTSLPERSDGAFLPVTSGYHVAARYGAVGSWSRYHTGIDFAAPVGRSIYAVASGTVTNAGRGSASWAGNYVSIRHADGRSTLYAHMSRVSVHLGEHVSAGHVVGAIGLTGRTFGPHLHFELYPAGAKPGDLYRAVNPAPWLRHLGLHY